MNENKTRSTWSSFLGLVLQQKGKSGLRRVPNCHCNQHLDNFGNLTWNKVDDCRNKSFLFWQTFQKLVTI